MAKKQYGIAASSPLDAVTKADLDAVAGGVVDTTIVRDSFNRADSATSPGNPDVGPAGTPTTVAVGGISGNQFYFPSGGSSWSAYTYETNENDVVAEVTLPVVNTSELPGLALRLLNSGSNADGLWFTHTSAYQMVAGAQTALGSILAQQFAGGDRMRVLLQGRQARVYRRIGNVGDWVFAARYDLPAALDNGTKHGLGRFTTGVGTSRYDDLWIGRITDEILTQSLIADLKGVGLPVSANGIGGEPGDVVEWTSPPSVPTWKPSRGGGRGTISSTSPDLTAAAANLISGTTIALPTGYLKTLQRYRWNLGVAKRTAAGTATWSISVRWGTGAITDGAIMTWTSSTNTAAIDQATLLIEVQVTATGASATMNGMAIYSNTLTNVTGLGKISPIPGSTAAFNGNLANPVLHVTITPGLSAVMTAVASAEQVA